MFAAGINPELAKLALYHVRKNQKQAFLSLQTLWPEAELVVGPPPDGWRPRWTSSGASGWTTSRWRPEYGRAELLPLSRRSSARRRRS